MVDVVIARGMLQQSNNLSVLLTIETQRGTGEVLSFTL